MLYLDFELTISHSTVAKDPDVYQFQVTRSPVIAVGGVVQLTLKRETEYIRQRLARISYQPSAPHADFRTYLDTELKQIGEKLYSLLPRYTSEKLEEAFVFARKQGLGLRLNLNLTAAPDLYNLPWELLFYAKANQFLALSVHTPIVRTVHTPLARPSRLANLTTLKVLVVAVATRADDIEYIAREVKTIRQIFASPVEVGEISLDFLDGVVTFNRFSSLVQSDTYNVIHFIGHGKWENTTDTASLVFHAETCSTQNLSLKEVVTLPTEVIKPADLKVVLTDLTALELLFLNSCEAGRVSSSEALAFADMSAGLVKAGIKAVVALQAAATQEAAVLFATELYRQLATGLENALTEARKALFLAARHNPALLGQWFIPVVYRAERLPPPKITWYEHLLTRVQDRLTSSAGDREFLGTVFLVFLTLLALATLPPLLGQLVNNDPAWQALFLDSLWSPYLVINSFKLAYFWQVFLPLSLVTTGLALSCAMWVHFDLRKSGQLGELDGRQKWYLFGLNVTGAVLGLITGLFLSYTFLAFPLYYLGLGDALPGYTGDTAKVLASLLTVFCTVWLARQIPLSSRAASHNFRPEWREKFIALALPFMPAIIFFLIMFVCPAFFFNRPWGGILAALAFVGFCLYEIRKIS